MDRLKGKIAIVTGGANGIGRAISEVFAEEGGRLVIVDIESETGESAAEEIRRKGGCAEFMMADVARVEDAVHVVEKAAEQTGRIDVLCNNAAYLGAFHSVLEAPDAEWERSIAVALLGARNFTRAALPYMISAKAGSIVNIVSIQALAACPTSVAYTTVKAGLLGFTASVAHDYGPHNIRVNAICPGPIQTRISPQPGSDAYRWQCEKTMLGRVGDPREVALTALFLASDEASYITGAVLPVDGGWTAK